MSGLLLLFGAALGLLIALLTAMLAWEMTHPPRHTAGYAIARNMACNPDDLGLSFESWVLERPDGARLPVWDVQGGQQAGIGDPQSTSDGPRPTAVFLHGWGHSRIDVLARIKPYHQLCDRMVFYDLRGHGDSEHCLSRLGDREPEDLLALLERINEDRVVLVGHSMGAVIAMRAVTSAPREIRERIAGMIAYGPYCEFHRSLCGRLKIAGFPARPITDLALLLLRAIGIRPLSLREEDLRDWPTPLRVIHGDSDAVAPLEHARRIVEAAGAEAMLQVIPGAAHTDAHAIDDAQHEEIVGGFFDHRRAKR